jgi:hypothetical protein
MGLQDSVLRRLATVAQQTEGRQAGHMQGTSKWLQGEQWACRTRCSDGLQQWHSKQRGSKQVTCKEPASKARKHSAGEACSHQSALGGMFCAAKCTSFVAADMACTLSLMFKCLPPLPLLMRRHTA